MEKYITTKDYFIREDAVRLLFNLGWALFIESKDTITKETQIELVNLLKNVMAIVRKEISEYHATETEMYLIALFSTWCNVKNFREEKESETVD